MAVPGPGAGILYNALKDLHGWFRRRFHRLTPEERLARREKWKERFREEIWNREKEELRQDVIIRDVRRLDDYPDGPEGKGISSWFRVAMVGQYHRGVQLGLSIHSLVFEESEGSDGAWRLAGAHDTKETTNAYLIGYVRYDDIEQVDWYGDEYYNFPHIYCHFASRGQPYEKLAFCERKSIHPKHYFFTEIAPYQQVRLTSQKFGTAKGYWLNG
jgi:hypothetical protein